MTDPEAIPEHVVAVARRVDDETMASGDTYLRVLIAAAFDALFDDKPLVVEPDDVVVAPRRVLAAILEREASR